MPVQFCDDCGSILPVSADEQVTCVLCGEVAQNQLLSYTHVAESSNFPSRLRTKLRSQTQTVSHKDIGNGPIAEIECPQCSNNKATWKEAQLRSADEGSTIFYCCTKCNARWQENN